MTDQDRDYMRILARRADDHTRALAVIALELEEIRTAITEKEPP